MERSILFVDDEERILRVLKRLFLKKEYHTYFAEGGQQALSILETEKIDLIITDLRMPEMDGCELLCEVKRRHPEVIRLVLSGFADEGTIYRLIQNNIAKMCIYKPWDNDFLGNSIKQIFELNHILASNSILRIIKNMEHLPVLDNLYTELCELMDCNASLKEIEQLLMKDHVIVASILHIVNSAFIHVNTGSLNKAISYLGLNQTKHIVFMSSIISGGKNHSELSLAYELFARHSLLINKLINLIYKEMLMKEIPPDNSCIGILHGIGRVVLMNNFSSEYSMIIQQWRSGKEELWQLEKNILGISHQEMSGYLLNWWGLPYSLIEPILFHHSPMSDNIMNRELTCVIYLADYYATIQVKEQWMKTLDESVFEYLDISRTELEILLERSLL